VPSGFSSTTRAFGVDQAGGRQLLADGGEQRRRGRQVEHAQTIETQVFEMRGERGPGQFVELAAGDEAPAMFVDQVQIFLARHLLACDADDAPALRRFAVAKAVVQRRQQLAHRQIAGAAEKDQVEFLQARARLRILRAYHVALLRENVFTTGIFT
jgi:hypothetical protein